MPDDYAAILAEIGEAATTYYQAVDAAAAVIASVEMTLQEAGLGRNQWMEVTDGNGQPTDVRLGWIRFPFDRVRGGKFRFVVGLCPPDDYCPDDTNNVRCWAEAAAEDKLATFNILPAFLRKLHLVIGTLAAKAEADVQAVTAALTAVRRT